VVYLKTEQL